MRVLKRILLTAFAVVLAGTASAQIFKRHAAGQNDSLRNGKYIDFWDADSGQINTKGYFYNNRPVKTWKYYYSDGTRRMKVKYHDKLKIKYYSPTGILEQKGYAVLDINSETIHFFWDGIWKYYKPRRKLYRIATFKMGEETAVIFGPEDPVYWGE